MTGWWIPALGGAVLMAFLAFLISGEYVHHIEAKDAEALQKQVQVDVQQCTKNNQPAEDANDYDKTHSDTLLESCLSSLHNANISLPVTGAPSSSKTASHPNTTITYYSIVSHNIQCQHALDDLNSAKTWAKSYQELQNASTVSK